MTRVAGWLGLSLLADLLQPMALAASVGELRALAQTIEQDLEILDGSQMLFGGSLPPQLITDIGRLVAVPSQIIEWRATAQQGVERLNARRIDESAAILEPLGRTTGAARNRAIEITSYWLQRSRFDRRLQQWQRFVKVNRIDPPMSAAIAEAMKRLDAAMAADDFALAGQMLLPQLTRLLDFAFVEGRKLAFGVTRDDRATRERTVPCIAVAGAKPPSSAERARLNLDLSQSTDSYYPPQARREEREGRVAIGVRVNASGCPTSAIALVSSGDEDLDAAALDWTLRGAVFTPAARDGQAVESEARLVVRFELQP